MSRGEPTPFYSGWHHERFHLDHPRCVFFRDRSKIDLLDYRKNAAKIAMGGGDRHCFQLRFNCMGNRSFGGQAMIPTSGQLLAAQDKRANSLKALLPVAIAQHGPATSAQLHARHGGQHNEKYVSGLLCQLAHAGVVTRLAREDDNLRLGGPRKWVFGLAGQTYPGWKIVAGGKNFREKVFELVRQQPATAEEVGAEFSITINAASATLCDLRRAGRINRVGLRDPRNPGDRPVWLYGVGPEFVPGLPVKVERRRKPDSPRRVVHIPDPARIAGRAYYPQMAGWGMWR